MLIAIPHSTFLPRGQNCYNFPCSVRAHLIICDPLETDIIIREPVQLQLVTYLERVTFEYFYWVIIIIVRC